MIALLRSIMNWLPFHRIFIVFCCNVSSKLVKFSFKRWLVEKVYHFGLKPCPYNKVGWSMNMTCKYFYDALYWSRFYWSECCLAMKFVDFSLEFLKIFTAKHVLYFDSFLGNWICFSKSKKIVNIIIYD